MSMTREEAIELLENLKVCRQAHTLFNVEKEAVDMAIEALKEQRPHGEWKQVTAKDGEYYCYHKCTNCGQTIESGFDNPPIFNFCPNCGADMSANDRQVTGKLKQTCPCDTCQTAICRCGCQMHLCSDYQKWKEGEKFENDRRGIPGIPEEK